jgi:hypothetical protein
VAAKTSVVEGARKVPSSFEEVPHWLTQPFLQKGLGVVRIICYN